MSVVRIREGPYYRGFFNKKCMRVLSVQGETVRNREVTVLERCLHGEVRLYLQKYQFRKANKCSVFYTLQFVVFEMPRGT